MENYEKSINHSTCEVISVQETNGVLTLEEVYSILKKKNYKVTQNTILMDEWGDGIYSAYGIDKSQGLHINLVAVTDYSFELYQPVAKNKNKPMRTAFANSVNDVFKFLRDKGYRTYACVNTNNEGIFLDRKEYPYIACGNVEYFSKNRSFKEITNDDELKNLMKTILESIPSCEIQNKV